MSEEKIICNVCFRHCCLSEGETGFCRVRKNEGGENVPVNYGLLTSLALDPIEKKPLARFMSGAMILSVGSFARVNGLNYYCCSTLAKCCQIISEDLIFAEDRT